MSSRAPRYVPRQFTWRRKRQAILLLTVIAIFCVPSFVHHLHARPPVASDGAAPLTDSKRSPPVNVEAPHVELAPLRDLSHVATEALVEQQPAVTPRPVPVVVPQQPEQPAYVSQKHPNFPKGAPIPRPYRLDTTQFSDKQRRVVDGIRHAFVNYKKYAWHHDELCPLRKSFSDWSHGSNSGIGLTAIEALDTLWLAGLYDEFHDVIAYLKSPEHTFHRSVEAGLFETTIRVLGGLLSAYELSGEPILLDKAYDIGSKLFRCIEGRKIPVASVYLDTGVASNPGWLGGSQSLAEVTTIQLEFKKLAYFTGERKFDDATTAVMHRVLDRMPKSGLYPIFINLYDGEPQNGQVTLGARGDSFYEYLVKQWALTNFTEDWLRTAYERVSNAVVDKLLVQLDGNHALIAESSSAVGGRLELKMDHLVCFAVGMLELGMHGDTKAKHDKAAADVARTCHEIYRRTATGLGVEIVRFHEKSLSSMFPSPGAHHYIMRPEVMEAMFYMQRFHPEDYDVWQEKAWFMYERMEEHLKVETGWTGLEDATVVHSGRRDKMESFFVAETLKYAFLCAADKDVAPTQLPLSQWVFNTEAHPLRVFSGPLVW